MGFKRTFATGAVPAVAVVAGLSATLVCGAKVSLAQNASGPGPVKAVPTATAESLEDSFMRISDKVGPATVFITAKMDAPSNGPAMQFNFGGDGDDSSPFGDLFGQGSPFPRRGGTPVPQNRTVTSSGSGVIVRPDGYILTNDHVVEGAKNGEVSVTLADGTTYNHCKVFRDRISDLAVVKVNVSKSLPYVSFADSSSLHVGQWAVAIGAPFGEENSMTAGIVSALNPRPSSGGGRTPATIRN